MQHFALNSFKVRNKGAGSQVMSFHCLLLTLNMSVKHSVQSSYVLFTWSRYLSSRIDLSALYDLNLTAKTPELNAFGTLNTP